MMGAPMSLSDLASLGSFVSGVAVLISLVYVSIQVRQAARHQRSLMMQGRAARVMNLQLNQTSPAFASIWLKAMEMPESLTDLEMAQAIAFGGAVFNSAEESWLEGREGLQSKTAHEATGRRIAQQFKSPFLRVIWTVTRPMFDPEFAEGADRLLAETQVVPYSTTLDGIRKAIAMETAKQT